MNPSLRSVVMDIENVSLATCERVLNVITKWSQLNQYSREQRGRCLTTAKRCKSFLFEWT